MLKITKKLAGFKLKLWQKWLGLKTFFKNLKRLKPNRRIKSRKFFKKIALLLGVASFLFLVSGIAGFAFFAKENGFTTKAVETEGCLKCYGTRYNVDTSLLTDKFYISDGIQCETCH